MNLANYYKILFSLSMHHKYSLSDLENLMPFERDLYVDMIIDYLESKKV